MAGINNLTVHVPEVYYANLLMQFRNYRDFAIDHPCCLRYSQRFLLIALE